MKYSLKKCFEKPLLFCNNNIVTFINDEFKKLCGFTEGELLGKPLTEVSCMLRIDSQIYLENINDKYDCYIFTKEYEPREVTISSKLSQSNNEKIYFFKEKLNSRIENKFPYLEQLYKDNQIGDAVYSFPDFVLLKANDKCLENYYSYNIKETAIGKKLKELVAEKEWNRVERHFFDVVNSGNSYYGKELEYKHPFRETKYYDTSLVPIYINKKARYIVHTLTDVTERVLNRKLAEEKTKQLEVILQNISDGVFICDKEGNSILANNVVKKDHRMDHSNYIKNISVFHKFYDMSGKEIPYERIHIKRALNGEKIKNERMKIVTLNGVAKIVEYNAVPTYDKNGNITGGAVLFTDITELNNQEKIINEQKEQLESIIESMYDGVYVVDKDMNITASNHSFRESAYYYNNFNKAGDPLVTAKCYDIDGNLLAPEDIPARRVFRGEKVHDLRLTAHLPNRILHLSYNGSPIYDNCGAVSKVVISVRDITEQVKNDLLIKRQHDMLNAIIENMSDELIIVDENGQYTMANKAFRNRISICASEPLTNELLMKKVESYDVNWNLIPYENLPSQRIAKGERLSHYRLNNKCKNGCIVNYESSGTPIYDNEGNFLAGVLVNRNINDRLKNEENKLMKAQYDILNKTIENLNLNFTLVSYPDAKIKYMNKNAFNYLKKINPKLETLDSCIGKNSYETFMFNMNEKAALDIKIKELINNKESHYISNRKFFVAGKEIFTKVIYQPLYNYNNEVTEVVLIGIDLTEEIKAKNKIGEALKLQEEIFTNVTHELKTPLNVIYSTIQLMEIYLKNSSLEANREKLSNNAIIIKQNCYRFMRLINNIVDSSKVKSGFLKLSLSNENIVEVVEDIVQSVSEYIKGKGINIIFDTDTEEKIIACDTTKIERIMLNLISNAVKFSNCDNNIYVNVSDKDDNVEISVRDTGIGIEKKYLDKIFNRFHQVDKTLSRNAEGSGIGLSLVKSFVKMHGGKISVDSEVGRGSIFKIELPSRIIMEDELAIDKIKPISNKIEMINIEFSDIYSI